MPSLNYIKITIDNMATFTLVIPQYLTPDKYGDIDPIYQMILMRNKFLHKKQDIIEGGMQKSHSLIMVKCRKIVYAKIKVIPDHPSIANSGNPILLLGDINTVMFNLQSAKCPPHTIHDCNRCLETIFRERRHQLLMT